jgi:ActR/RegA family two-component response regulator
MQPGLQALLLCTDESAVRVLRRALSELEIGVEHCSAVDAVVQRLTRQRFEAIIIECEKPEVTSKLLTVARLSPVNKRAITVVIVDGQPAINSALKLGAHFLLFKPVALEKTRSSFRSVKALMKRERRRNVRVPVEIPIELHLDSQSVRTVTVDVSEKGVAIRSKHSKQPGPFGVRFTLPGTITEIECRGEVAWEGDRSQGIRFGELSHQSSEQLKSWIHRELTGAEPEEPTVNCKLTDLSLNACYFETESPFPICTRLDITMSASQSKLQIEGIVRLMHSGMGMGVEFTQQTPMDKTRVAKFIQTLMSTAGEVPQLQVRPDMIDSEAPPLAATLSESDDPLLWLFHSKSDLPAEDFQVELHKQRGGQPRARAQHS